MNGVFPSSKSSSLLSTDKSYFNYIEYNIEVTPMSSSSGNDRKHIQFPDTSESVFPLLHDYFASSLTLTVPTWCPKFYFIFLTYDFFVPKNKVSNVRLNVIIRVSLSFKHFLKVIRVTMKIAKYTKMKHIENIDDWCVQRRTRKY